jgi:hypothetical protein
VNSFSQLVPLPASLNSKASDDLDVRAAPPRFYNTEKDKVLAYNLTVSSGLAEVKKGAIFEIPSTVFDAFVPVLNG